MSIIKFKYKSYPKLVEVMKKRHSIYNKTIRRIEKLGVTKEDLCKFCDQVYEFTDGRSFNVRSIQKEGFGSHLFDLGFSDMFYNDVLSMDGRFSYSTFYGTFILNKEQNSMVLASFLKEVISQYDGVDVYDLINELEQRYGCAVSDRIKLIYSAQSAGCYYDNILDRLYADKNAYYQDVYTEEY